MLAVMLRPELDNDLFEQAAARIRNIPYVKRDAGHRLALVRFLIDKGADVNASNGRGSVLAHAVGFGDVALTRLLLEAGADIDGACGPSPIAHASLMGNGDVVTLLRERGASDDPSEAVSPAIREAVAHAMGVRAPSPTFLSQLAGKIKSVRKSKKDS